MHRKKALHGLGSWEKWSRWVSNFIYSHFLVVRVVIFYIVVVNTELVNIESLLLQEK